MLRNKLPNSYNILIELISAIKEKYIDQCNKNKEIPNPERIDSLDYQVSAIRSIQNVSERFPSYRDPKDLMDASWGVFLSGYVNIDTSYQRRGSFFGPVKAYGYLFNSGSDVYTIYLEKLAEIGIKDHDLSEQGKLDKLYYLLKYYDFAFNNSRLYFKSNLANTEKDKNIYIKAGEETFASIQFSPNHAEVY